MERGSDKDAFTKKTTLCERKVGALCGERLTQASLGERVGPLGRDGQCPFDMLFVREMVRRWGMMPSKRGGSDSSWPGGEPGRPFRGEGKACFILLFGRYTVQLSTREEWGRW